MIDVPIREYFFFFVFWMFQWKKSQGPWFVVVVCCVPTSCIFLSIFLSKNYSLRGVCMGWLVGWLAWMCVVVVVVYSGQHIFNFVTIIIFSGCFACFIFVNWKLEREEEKSKEATTTTKKNYCSFIKLPLKPLRQ